MLSIFSLRLLRGTALAAACAIASPLVHAVGAPFAYGDVFAAVGNGEVYQYTSAGVLKGTLNTTSGGFTTGMAFDGGGNLYVTGFSANTLAKFNSNGTLVTANYATGLSTPESVVFDQAGNFYVGNLGNGIRKYDAGGAFLGTVINTRVDFFDLSADQNTFIYGQEGTAIKTVTNAIGGASGPDFASGLTNAFGMRYLADGGVLVADHDNVKRYNSAGVLVQTYDSGSENSWFSLNLDPDGTSFWSGNFNSGVAYKFDISGGTMLGSINTLVGGTRLFGLAVYGEETEGGPPPPTNGVPDAGSSLLLLGISLSGLVLYRRKLLSP